MHTIDPEHDRLRWRHGRGGGVVSEFAHSARQETRLGGAGGAKTIIAFASLGSDAAILSVLRVHCGPSAVLEAKNNLKV